MGDYGGTGYDHTTMHAATNGGFHACRRAPTMSLYVRKRFLQNY
jgi:hypothetical protein